MTDRAEVRRPVLLSRSRWPSEAIEERPYNDTSSFTSDGWGKMVGLTSRRVPPPSSLSGSMEASLPSVASR